MDNISYRAWYPEKQKMYEVAKVDMWGDPDQATCDLAAIDEELFDIYLCEVVLMQYTGRKDINNKEICEGDIVRVSSDKYIRIIEWSEDEASFKARMLPNETENIRPLYMNEEDFEVLGNIHENPALQGGKR